MLLLHKNKGGKVNEIPLDSIAYRTRHKSKSGVNSHEGWCIKGQYTEKSHEYTLLFSVEEAKEFKKFLEQMLERFEDDELTFIQEEEHDD